MMTLYQLEYSRQISLSLFYKHPSGIVFIRSKGVCIPMLAFIQVQEHAELLEVSFKTMWVTSTLQSSYRGEKKNVHPVALSFLFFCARPDHQMDIIHAWWIWVEFETHHKKNIVYFLYKLQKGIKCYRGHYRSTLLLYSHEFVKKNVCSVCTSTSGISLITGTLSKHYSSNKKKRHCFSIFHVYLLLAMSWEANCDDWRIFSTLKQRTGKAAFEIHQANMSIELEYIQYTCT